MIDNIKSMLIGLTKEVGPNKTSSVFAYGLSLARLTHAHVTVQSAALRLTMPFSWNGWYARDLVLAENERLRKLAEADAREAHADASAAGVVCSVESPQLPYDALLDAFVAQARVHDLVLVDAEPEDLTLDRSLTENLLLSGGRPLIVVPAGCEAFRNRHILIAWDGSASAARAVGDALPLLKAAQTVEIVSVTGEKELPKAIMGADLAPNLARHDVTVRVNAIPAPDADVAAALRNHAQLQKADMIVMGGYVHSRLLETMFGGVTRSLLGNSSVPLFMSH